jgi:radical SAM superfamily enzyme with C-terminal helix-hairpin-helix motif
VPVDPTQVDEATLATLPGVSADKAATLAKDVPYASDDAFLQAVAAFVSPEQAAAIPMQLASKAQPSVTWVKFNLNKASDVQLKSIPGVDDAVLQAINAAKPYDSIKTFRSNLGKSVDASVVSTIEGYVYVPVDVTKADAETLAQLPGVGSDQADELIKGVPYASIDAFVQALTAQVSADQAAQAKEYLA